VVETEAVAARSRAHETAVAITLKPRRVGAVLIVPYIGMLRGGVRRAIVDTDTRTGYGARPVAVWAVGAASVGELSTDNLRA
jgi:hypothetical protein